jgi:hypothetical protein
MLYAWQQNETEKKRFEECQMHAKRKKRIQRNEHLEKERKATSVTSAKQRETKIEKTK